MADHATHPPARDLIGEDVSATVDTAPASPETLPEYPLPSLEASVELFLSTVTHIGTQAELESTRRAADELLRENGLGRKLQERLELRTRSPNLISWHNDLIANALWLRTRSPHPRDHSFFCALPRADTSQAQQASLITLAAYEYKLSRDRGDLEPIYQDGLPLCMYALRWLFNANRTPALGCDRIDVYPDNDFIVAMRDGHTFQIPLQLADGQTISYQQLHGVFKEILDYPIPEPDWHNILTTDNRDHWSKVRVQMINSSAANMEAITAIEHSLFTVCLENGSPETTDERVQTFFFDDNRNKWLDKVLSFVVAANGASAIFCEHGKLDFPPLKGFFEAVSKATETPAEMYNGDGLDAPRGGFTFLPTSIPPELQPHVDDLRARYRAQVSGFTLRKYTCNKLGAQRLVSRKLSPKAVVAVIIEVALRRFCGYSPPVCNTLSQYHFKGGRVDLMATTTRSMAEFCDACLDPQVSNAEKKRLLAEAARSYGQQSALLRWAKGWSRHLFGVSEMVDAGESMPSLFTDPVYQRVRPGKAFFTFQPAPGSEMGSLRPVRDGFWMSVDVDETQVDYVILNGDGTSAQFVSHLKAATSTVKKIIG